MCSELLIAETKVGIQDGFHVGIFDHGLSRTRTDIIEGKHSSSPEYNLPDLSAYDKVATTSKHLEMIWWR